jgi:AcrR family transcriptional regulator
MAASKAGREPRRDGSPPAAAQGGVAGERYQRLPTGTHGLDPELVKHHQRARLRTAMVELIAVKGYPAVRILDLAKLAHVSQPTFYALFRDKEDLFLSAYDQIARKTARTVLRAYATGEAPGNNRLLKAMQEFARLAVTEPEAMSLLMLGAFGAGPKALERRRRTISALEASIHEARDGTPAEDDGDLVIKAVLGGIREVTAARLREGRAEELPILVEDLARWAAAYPPKLPAGLEAPPLVRHGRAPGPLPVSERARAAEGRLPSGRSELPRHFIVKSQRERIVDATAAIVAEKGLAALTIPEITRRANVSNQTFYSIYASKHEAFLGAQKVGMHQALQVAIEAYSAAGPDWPKAVAAGLRALIDYLASEPAHAHLSLVDTFGASPEAIEIRRAALASFAAYLQPGYERAPDPAAVPVISGEAIAGGVWQILHHYVENDCIEQLRETTPQLTYIVLAPFIGAQAAAAVARGATRRQPAPA